MPDEFQVFYLFSSDPLSMDSIKFVFGLILFIAIIVLCYFLLKWMANKSFLMNRGTYLKIIDRMMVARDTQIAIVRAGGRIFAVGITKDGVSLLTELNEADLEPLTQDSGLAAGFFRGAKQNENHGQQENNQSFMKRFAHNLAVMSGFSKTHGNFQIPENKDSSANINAAFRDILTKNQDEYEKHTQPDGSDQTGDEYEFKQQNLNQSVNPIQKPVSDGGSGQSSIFEQDKTPSEAIRVKVPVSKTPETKTPEVKAVIPDYSAAVEKMRRSNNSAAQVQPDVQHDETVQKINDAIDKAASLSSFSEKTDESLDSMMQNIAKRKDRYKKDIR